MNQVLGALIILLFVVAPAIAISAWLFLKLEWSDKLMDRNDFVGVLLFVLLATIFALPATAIIVVVTYLVSNWRM